jgi:DNA-binding transcriptional ArsR family regulator
MRQLEPSLVAFEFLRPMWDHAGDRDPAKLADPAVRAHVATLLADAGVLATRRDGYYVLYSFVPERVGPLADALLDYLGGGAEEAGAGPSSEPTTLSPCAGSRSP